MFVLILGKYRNIYLEKNRMEFVIPKKQMVAEKVEKRKSRYRVECLSFVAELSNRTVANRDVFLVWRYNVGRPLIQQDVIKGVILNCTNYK